MSHFELLAPLFILVVICYSLVTGEIFLPSYPFGAASFKFYSEPSNVDRDWAIMPFFLGAVILLGFFIVVGPHFPSSQPAPTFIADVDPSLKSVKSVKSVSHKSTAHHKRTNHAHQAHS
jgi:hypothetical protein